jgi:hypothetical protein
LPWRCVRSIPSYGRIGPLRFSRWRPYRRAADANSAAPLWRAAGFRFGGSFATFRGGVRESCGPARVEREPGRNGEQWLRLPTASHDVGISRQIVDRSMRSKDRIVIMAGDRKRLKRVI